MGWERRGGAAVSTDTCCGKGWEARLGCAGLRAPPGRGPAAAAGGAKAWSPRGLWEEAGLPLALGSQGLTAPASGCKASALCFLPCLGHLCTMFLSCGGQRPNHPAPDCFVPTGAVGQAAVYPQ